MPYLISKELQNMSRQAQVFFVTLFLSFAVVEPMILAQDVKPRDDAGSAERVAIRQRMELYLEAFNRHDASALGAFWSQDCVSLAEDSGERISGRESLIRHFSSFFRDSPTAQLSGEISDLKLVRRDVALIEGRTTLFIANIEPVVSVYSSLLVKEGDEWLISNCRERDIPLSGSRGALRELEWLVGTWRDQSGDTTVSTTFSWSPNKAFLIRSFTVQYPDADMLEGTQVFGWDPLNSQIRTWTFNSDGSFGQGTVSRHDNEWLLKMSQVLSDGKRASATQVITRVDPHTITVQIIGETIDGEPIPSSAAITVSRVEDSVGSTIKGAPGKPGVQP